MKTIFDKILIGLLWLITITLATTFWMNIRYGFNILSAAHWEYFSTLQATNAKIALEFYLSLVVAVFIAVTGLYMLLRPRLRKIQLKTQATETKPIPQPSPNHSVSTGRPVSPMGMRSTTNHSQLQSNTKKFNTSPVATAPTLTPPGRTTEPTNPLSSEIQSIFESAGYIMKPCKKISGLNNPVIALGYNQTIWIGTSNASVESMQDAIQTLIAVFDDTLGDTAEDLSIRGCIINPTDTTNNNPDLISTFADIGELQSFMTEHQNTKPDGFDEELFDAVSTYISTVMGYIGKS